MVWLSVLYGVGSIAALVFALRVYGRRKLSRSASAGAGVALVTGLWLLAQLWSIWSTTIAGQLFSAEFQLILVGAGSLLWLVWVLRYCGYDKYVNRRLFLGLGLPLGVFFLLTLTNERHGLIWSVVDRPDRLAFEPVIERYNVGFWLFVCFIYGIFTAGTGVIMYLVIRSRKLYRWEVAVLVAATILPWAIGLVETLGGTRSLRGSWTSLFIPVGVLAVGWTYHRLGPGGIRPIARDAVVNGMADPVFVVDYKGRVIDLNPAAGSVLTEPASTCMGRPLVEVWPSCPFELGQPFALENGVQEATIDRGSTSRTFDVSTSPILDWKGQLLAVVVALRDVTERRRAERDRQRYREQILRGEKLESLGVLAGGVAHRFNNLLTVILGNAELAAEASPPTSPSADNLSAIRNAVMEAAGLASQMAAYSGHGAFLRRPIDLTEEVREVVELPRKSLGDGARLRLELQSGLPLVAGDPTQIRHLVIQLWNNAAEALGNGPGEIVIRTGHGHFEEGYLSSDGVSGLTAPAGQFTYVEVKDTGCGIAQGDRERIFDPFYSTKFTGRGLGLAAVLGIARGHGAVIRVESQPGAGATVRVLFPALKTPS